MNFLGLSFFKDLAFLPDVLASLKFGTQQNFLKGLLQKYFDGKANDKNNY